jgi:hypothetical protein
MKEVVLNEEQLKALDAYLQELPMKYGAPIVSFLNEIIKGSEQAEELTAE